MTVKRIDTYSKKWPVAIAGVLSGMYMFFVLPFHIPVAIYSVFNFDEFMSSRYLSDKFIAISSFIVPLAIAIAINAILKQRKNIKAFVSFFSETGLSEPMPQNVSMSWTGLAYVALDTKMGTLLYINHPDTKISNFFFPKDVRVMGFGMYDWKSIELVGNQLTIYTGNPELPAVTINTRKAAMLYEKINAMRAKQWSYEYSIPGYVEHQAKRIAESNEINLILPPR